MKGKINGNKIKATLLITVFILTTLAIAIPVSAVDYTGDDYEAAVLLAADNLFAKQNDDGGFDWKYDGNNSKGSGDNVGGVGAIGILKAYELLDKAEYEISLAEAYKFAVDKPPTYVWYEEEWTEKAGGGIRGVESYPDITFLLGLAKAASTDSTLLAAITAKVSETTEAVHIANLAKTRWDGRLNHLGDTDQDEIGTATDMAIRIRDDRHGQGYDALIPWDLEAAVKAALALDSYFTGEGYDQQAVDIAQVLYDSIDDVGALYFDSDNDTQIEYVLGLTGAIEAFSELGINPTLTRTLTDLLILYQNPSGYWDFHNTTTPIPMSVQSTAYAVMALLAQGDADALASALEGSNWLVAAQEVDGYWFAEDGAGDEYLEMDSEAAWALFMHTLTIVEPSEPGDAVDTTVTGDGSFIVPDADTTVTYTGADDDTIIIEDLAEEEFVEGAFGAVGEYVDVKLAADTLMTELEIRVYYDDPEDLVGVDDESLLIMYWYDGTNWGACSDTGVETDDDYIWAKIRIDTSPPLFQMTGTPFAPGEEGLALDAEIYGTGADVEVSIGYVAADLDHMRLDIVNVTATSTTDETGIVVYLTETGAATGVFTGSFPTTGEIPPPADHLVVDDGDEILVEYFEGSFSVTAVIDDVAPEIEVDLLEEIIGLNLTDVTGTYVESNLDKIIVNGMEATFGGGTFTVAAVPLLHGNNTITAIATDLAGFTNSSSTWIISDTVGPVITNQLATPLKSIIGGTTKLSATLTDEFSNVTSISYNLTAIGGGIMVDGFPLGNTTILWEYNATVGAGIEDGTYYLNLTASDQWPNYGDTVTIEFWVVTDAESPVMGDWTVDYPIGKTDAREGDVVNVTVVATDLPAGISQVVINGSDIGAAPDTLMAIIDTDEYFATLPVGTGVLDGTYYLNITATDYAGNEAFTLAEVLIQELATMEMYTLYDDYDSGDTVDFYVEASFAFNMTIEITDPTDFLYETITVLEATHWVRVGDYSIVPYEASFDLPSTAVSGTWSWTAIDTDFAGEVANGTFTVEVIIPTETGTVNITTTPVSGEVFVDDESWGTAPAPQEVEVGDYTVSYGDVEGYTTPDSEEVTVTADTTIDVEGIYTEITVLPQLVITYTPVTVYEGDEVTITVEAEEAPIADADVGILNPTLDIALLKVTDELGQCTFTANEAGEWFVGAKKDDYTDADITIDVLEAVPPELPAETTGQETLDTNGAPKTSFVMGESILASASVENVGMESQKMLIVYKLTDPGYHTIINYAETTLPPGIGLAPKLNFVIPDTGYTPGTWTLTVMIIDDWPALGGEMLGEPVTFTFTVE